MPQKKINKIRGYIFLIFPVDYLVEKDEVVMVDCWTNKYFMWLFQICNSFVGFFAPLLGRTTLFVISFRGKEKEKFKEIFKPIKDK